jgi:hypothetical protein
MIKIPLIRVFFFFILSISLPFSLFSQGNLPGEDYKPFHFGFSLGLNTMDFGIQESGVIQGGKVYHADVSTLKPGFSVGIVTDMMVVPYVNLRCTPTLNFGERELTYRAGNDPETTSITISSIPLNVPLLLKLSSERNGNVRPYLLVGTGVSYDLANNKDNPVFLRPLDVYFEFGLGCDLYFSFFKLAPELKLAFGKNNLFVPLSERTELGSLTEEQLRYANALSKLTSRMLTLTFNFE